VQNKTSVNVTPAQCVTEFGKEKFCVQGGLLWCKICDVPVDHVQQQTIADHVLSKKHKTRLGKHEASDAASDAGPAPKRQLTVVGCRERMTEVSAAKKKLVLNLVDAFMSANIPLEKLDNAKMREFLDTSIKGSGGVPLANTLCERYVPKMYVKQQENISKKLTGQKTAVIVDETTDVMGWYIANVLMQPLDAFEGAADCQAL